MSEDTPGSTWGSALIAPYKHPASTPSANAAVTHRSTRTRFWGRREPTIGCVCVHVCVFAAAEGLWVHLTPTHTHTVYFGLLGQQQQQQRISFHMMYSKVMTMAVARMTMLGATRGSTRERQ